MNKEMAENIRRDLKNIRYYYARKNAFENASLTVGQNTIIDKLDIYNNAIRFATPRLYDLYVTLYTQNNTQDSLSEKWGYSLEHVSRLHSQLVRFFLNYFEKENINV
mgnify:CR=1 FL=1